MLVISTNPSCNQRGFTIVELMVVMAVLSILIVLVLETLGSFYQSNTTSLTQTVQTTDTRSVLRSIESDLTNATGFKNTTTMTPVIPTGSDDNDAPWSHIGDSTNRVLIASAYATTSRDENRSLVYLSDSGCDPATGTPLQYNLIYFVKRDPATGEKNLYRRTMLPTDAQCGPPFAIQKQSCANNKVATNPGVCKGSDAVLLHNVSKFEVDYFASPVSSTTVPDQYAADGDISSARSVTLKVTTTRNLDGKLQDLVGEIRISLLN